MAPRPASLDGKTIYLVDVTFNGGDLFLMEMEKWMKANMPEVNAVYRIKRGRLQPGRPGTLAGDSIRRWPDGDGHRPLKHLCAGGRRPRC